MRLLLSFLATICLAAVAQQTAVFLPFLWTTPTVVSISASQIHYYHVPLCGIPQYNNKYLNIKTDFPAIPWSPNPEIVLYISVYNNSNFSGNPIQTNKDPNTGWPQQEFSFLYLLAYGDLYLAVAATTPPSDISYTLSIVVAETGQRSVFSESWFAKARNKSGAKNIDFGLKTSAPVSTDLLQLLYNPSPFAVSNSPLNPLLIDFTFCPTGNTYTLDVTVVAVDEASAFSTYLCTNFSASQPCSASRGKDHSDPKGAALNHVSMPTNTREFTTIEAAVYGVGNYGTVNHFLFTVDVN